MSDDSIQNCFSSLNLSEQVLSKLRGTVEELRAFESTDRAKIPTRAARIKALREIERSAHALGVAIKSLDNGSFFSLDQVLVISTDASSALRDAIGPRPGAYANHVQQMMCDLAASTSDVASELADRGRSGRKEVLPAYAGFIAAIAYEVKADQVPPGRGGRFERICEAVFTAAGAHAKPEGALRYFLDNMLAHHQARGLVHVESGAVLPNASRKNPLLKAVK